MFNGSKKWRNLYLTDIVLLLLVVLSELPRIYVISKAEWMLTAINYLQIPLYLCLVFIILKRKYSIKLLVMTAFLELILLIGYIQSGQAAYFRGLLLLLALKDVSFKRSLRICRTAITSVCFLSILLYILGISNAGIQRRGYVAFGFVHPNIAAQTITIITLLWITERAETLRIRDYVAIELTGILLFIATGSRTTVIVLMLTPIMFRLTQKLMNSNMFNSLTSLLLESSQILFFIMTVLFAELLPNSLFLKKLDLLFANRLFLNYYQLANHSVLAFGQNVELRISDVYNNIQDVWGAAVTCDNSYVMSLIIMGLIPTIIFALGYVISMRKALRERNYIIAAVAVILVLYGFFEAQMLEIYINFIYFYITAECAQNSKTTVKEKRMVPSRIPYC